MWASDVFLHSELVWGRSCLNHCGDHQHVGTFHPRAVYFSQSLSLVTPLSFVEIVPAFQSTGSVTGSAQQDMRSASECSGSGFSFCSALLLCNILVLAEVEQILCCFKFKRESESLGV